MHGKVEHLFAQKQEGIRQNKLPAPLLILLLQIIFSVNFSIRYIYLVYLQATTSITLIVTFNFLLIFFDIYFP